MNRNRTGKTRFGVLATLTLLVAVCGLVTVVQASAAQVAPEDVTIFGMYKRLDQGWFQNESAGAEARAQELGIKIQTLDNRFDANVMTTNLDTAISQNASGIIMVVPDQQLGPAVIARTKAANIPLIAVDDFIVDTEGNPAPFVGMNTVQIGTDVGNLLVDFATTNNLMAEGTTVRAAALTFDELDVCKQRTDATKKTLLEKLPGFTEEMIIEANYAGANTDGGFQTMSGLITSNPQVTNWLIYSCNEEGVVGAVRALEAASKAPGSCGVGLGDGALAEIELLKPEANAYCGSIYINSANHGATAVQLLYDFLVNGTPIPLETLTPGIPVTRANAAEVFGGAGTPAA